jgi:dTDP-4-dehydrorhamnose reductase
MKKKILVLGSTGMLGHQVVKLFLEDNKYEVFDISYRNKLREQSFILDVTNKSELKSLIEKIEPDYIINCIGILIGGSNENIANAIYINAYLPHFLKELCVEIGAKLVHISTDCVFSGKQQQPYAENDSKDGEDTYAQTKALGEVIDNTNLTLRTSIIGPEIKSNGEGLFHWFMHQSGAVNGFTKAIWSGVTTIELAKVIKKAIEQELVGLYHVTNNSSINKYELLKLFQKYTQKDITIDAVDGKTVNKSFIDTRGELQYDIPTYDQMVREMIEDIQENSKLYNQYVKYMNV